MKKTQEEILQYWKWLKKKPNVVGIDGKLRSKIKNKKAYRKIKSLRIYVSKKVALEDVLFSPSLWEKIKRKLRRNSHLHKQDLVPPFVDGIPTDVIAIGEIFARSNRDYLRPLKAGISSMHYKGSACTTNGFFREEETGKICVASNNHCFIEGTKVLSNPSFLDFKEASNVIGISGLTRIKNHFSRSYKGQIIKINFRGKKVCCTPEHPILIVSPIKIYSYSHRQCPKYDLKKKEWKFAKDLKKFDLLLVPKNNTFSKELNLEFAKWLGFYIAEGSISDHGSSKTVNLDNFNREKLLPYLSFFGGKIISEERKEGTLYRIKIYNTKLANWLLRQVGKEKRIPEFVLKAGVKSKQAFLSGMLEGDGTVRGNNKTIFTKFPELCNDFYALLLSLNIVPSFWQTIQDHEYNGYKWTSRIFFLQWNSKPRMYEDKEFLYVPLYEIGSEDFSGIVKNLETEDGTYCVPFIVHNCYADENKAKIGDPIIQPSPSDQGKWPEHEIAKLYKYVPIQFNHFACPFRRILHKFMFWEKQTINTVDIAFALLSAPWVAEATYIGPFKGKRLPKEGEKVQKTGRTTEYTVGKVQSVNWIGSVNYDRGVASFGDCILVEAQGFSAGGDSGSPVFDMNGNYIGALFAGSSTHTIICKVSNIEIESGMFLIIKES